MFWLGCGHCHYDLLVMFFLLVGWLVGWLVNWSQCWHRRNTITYAILIYGSVMDTMCRDQLNYHVLFVFSLFVIVRVKRIEQKWTKCFHHHCHRFVVHLFIHSLSNFNLLHVHLVVWSIESQPNDHWVDQSIFFVFFLFWYLLCFQLSIN